jgi:hypothetical protein
MPSLTVTAGTLTVTLTISGVSAAGVVYGVPLTGATQDGCNVMPVSLWGYSANGSQTVAMNRGAYLLFAVEAGAVSNVQHRYVGGVEDTIHGRVLDAVYSRIVSLALPGVAGRIHKRVQLENIGGVWPAVLLDIPNGSSETPGPNGGSNERSDWGYPVRVTIADRMVADVDPDTQLKPLLRLRRIAFSAFDRVRLSPPQEVFDTQVQPGPIRQEYTVEGTSPFRILGTTFTVRAIARMTRG